MMDIPQEYLHQEAIDHLVAKQLNKPAIVYVISEREMSKTSLDNVIVVAMSNKEKDAVSDNPTIEDLIKAGDEYYKKGEELLRKEEKNEATEMFGIATDNYRKAHELKPNDIFLLHKKLAEAYLKVERTDEAIELFEKAVRLYPRSAELHNDLGVFYMDKGLNDRAIKEYEKAKELDPNYSEPYGNLGYLYHKQGNLEKAMEEYKKAIKINSKDFIAHYGLGIVYYYVGDSQKDNSQRDKFFQMALDEFGEALKINPDHKNSIQSKNYVLKKLGK